MKKNQIILGSSILIIIIAIGIGVFATNNSSKSDKSENYGSTKTTEISVSLNNSSSLSSNPNSNSTSSTQINSSSSSVVTSDKASSNVATSKVTVESGYTTYNSNKLVNAQYGKVILFFHATWCPSCKGLDTDIKNNVGNIPNDTLILKVDYDSNPDLKSKYKVTSQHTLVQVNQNGDLLKTSPGLYQLNTLDSVIKTF